MLTEDGCLVVEPGQGLAVRGASQAPTVQKASGDETGGRIAVFEQTTPAQTGPPLHVHHESAEMFYVLEGEFIFRVGDRECSAPKGTFLFVPSGVPHTYANAGQEPARILYWFTPPARMSQYFIELSNLPAGATDRAQLDAIAKRHGVEIVGDPINQPR